MAGSRLERAELRRLLSCGTTRRDVGGIAANLISWVMAKKTGAQLDREIAAVLTKPRAKQVAQAARSANDQLYDLIHGRYFQSIPLDQIFGIVEAAGFHFDPEEKQVILTGRDGKATWELYWEPGRTVNHMLVLTWHKMDVTGRYEVVAYVS